MKKRILSILLLCCMMLTLLPTTALAAESAAYNRSPWYMVPGCVDDDIFSVP